MKDFTKKLGVGFVALGLGAGSVAVFGASLAAADTTTTTTTLAPTTTTTKPPAIPVTTGITKDFAIHADTATISGETPAVDAACSPTNTFQIGQTILFRMYGENLASGKTLLAANTKSVTVSIPGITTGSTASVVLAYSVNDGYWTGTLKTAGYAPGAYNYTMTVVSNRIAGVKGRKAVKASATHKAVKAIKAVKSIPTMTYVYGTGPMVNQVTVSLVTSLTAAPTTTTTVG
jgi:hypothetical protein